MAGYVGSHPSSVTTFVIGGAAAKTASPATPNDLNNGEIAAFLADGKNTKAKTDNLGSYNIKLCYKDNNGELHWTPEIPANATVRAIQAVAAVEQVSTVGFNGTSGSITAVDDTIYQMKAVLRTTMVSSLDGSSNPTFEGFYKSDSSATQEEIANGLYLSFRLATSNKRNPEYFKTERLMPTTNDAALGTGTATSATIKFTKNSKVVSGFVDVTNGTDSAAFAVGDYIRVGTTATAAVYKIVAIDAVKNAIVLDAPYVGETALFDDIGLKFITAANATAANWGIKVTGLVQPWSLDRKNYEQINFELLGGKNLDVTDVTRATKGSGQYKEVAQLEFFHVTSDGSRDHLKMPPTEFPRNLLASDSVGGYDILVASWTSDSISGIMKNALQKSVIVAIPADRAQALYAAGGATDDISDILETYFSGLAGGALA